MEELARKSDMKPNAGSLPEILQPLFWDQDFASLNWETDRDFIVRRILQMGSWSAVRWLRSTWGDEALRTWLEARAGAPLGPRQLRFWELVLDLPSQQVEHWIARSKDNPWERRVQP